MATHRVPATVEVQALLFALFGSANAFSGNLSLTEVFDGLVGPEFPHRATFFVYVKFRRVPASFHFSLRLEDEEFGTILWSSPESACVAQPDQPLSLLAQANVEFKGPKSYVMRAFVDGTEVWHEELPVKHLMTPAKTP